MNRLIRKGADSKVSLYKDKGGRMMICHPYLVTKRMARHMPLLQEKAHLRCQRQSRPAFLLNEAGKLACVSPEERA